MATLENPVEKHTHTQCQHEDLLYCAHCDLIYCKKCGREWPTEKIVYYVPEAIPYISPWTITWGYSSGSAGHIH